MPSAALADAPLHDTLRGRSAPAVVLLAKFDARGQVAAIRHPTLIVAGDRDTSVPLAAKVALAAAISCASLLVVPASGHATPHDQPQAFNRALLESLAMN
jgi:pimeloyl-ACP methyl ester carboxylesterase